MNKAKNPYIEHTSRVARAGRFLLGLKQKALADEIGSSQGHISKIESGELLPELSDWISLCEHIGINAHESYLTGFIDGNSTHECLILKHHKAFKVNYKFTKNNSVFIREFLPFIEFIESTWGKEVWLKFLNKRAHPASFCVLNAKTSVKLILEVISLIKEANGIMPYKEIAENAELLIQESTPTLTAKRRNSSIHQLKAFAESTRKFENVFEYCLLEEGNKEIVLFKVKDQVPKAIHKHPLFIDYIRYKLECLRTIPYFAQRVVNTAPLFDSVQKGYLVPLEESSEMLLQKAG